MNKKLNKQFFWLFAIIGFFLSVFLFTNEFFLNQIASERFNLEMKMCVNNSNECDLDVLISSDLTSLNANQLKLIELDIIIKNYNEYVIKVIQIFFAFIFIGLIPHLIMVFRVFMLKKLSKN
tara:strand:+ start:1242 stop:1607 length:366 start_codon:yes stop_codon:yes gene_type:complete